MAWSSGSNMSPAPAPVRATQEITEFQKEKQQALNQIAVIVNLKMHQVRGAPGSLLRQARALRCDLSHPHMCGAVLYTLQHHEFRIQHLRAHTCTHTHARTHTPLQVEYLVDRKLPEDMSAGLVFSSRELERLKNRICVSLGCCGRGTAAQVVETAARPVAVVPKPGLVLALQGDAVNHQCCRSTCPPFMRELSSPDTIASPLPVAACRSWRMSARSSRPGTGA